MTTTIAPATSFYGTVDQATTEWFDDPEGRAGSPYLNAREAEACRRAMGLDW